MTRCVIIVKQSVRYVICLPDSNFLTQKFIIGTVIIVCYDMSNSCGWMVEEIDSGLSFIDTYCVRVIIGIKQVFQHSSQIDPIL